MTAPVLFWRFDPVRVWLLPHTPAMGAGAVMVMEALTEVAAR